MGKPEFLELLAFRPRADSCRRHGADHLAADGGAGGAGVVRHAQAERGCADAPADGAGGRRARPARRPSRVPRRGTRRRLLPFVGTLWLFIGAANLIGLVPGLRSPTGDLSLDRGAGHAGVSVRCTGSASASTASGPICATISSPIRSCCRFTCWARSPARWPWPCACSAT